jgi:hypothetical protein
LKGAGKQIIAKEDLNGLLKMTKKMKIMNEIGVRN